MNISKVLVNVFTLPEYQGRQNVICRVHWVVRFEEDGFSSTAGVETFFDVDNIQNFIPANEVGNQRILQWATDVQGGDAFMAQLSAIHGEDIKHQKQTAGQQAYSEGFVLSEVPAQSPVRVGPTG